MKIDTDKVAELVTTLERNFKQPNKTSKYVSENIQEDIDQTYAYLNSKHISGDTDSLGRQKPFFNIVTAAKNIRYRATDIDTKNVNLKPKDDKEVILAFVAQIKLRKWMNRKEFGLFLNKWGMELSAFNSSVVKSIDSNGKLNITIVPWGRLLFNVADFKNNPKVELLTLTPEKLIQRGYNKKQVNKLIDGLKESSSTDSSPENKDSSKRGIKLYELHGMLPKSYLTGRVKDKETYVQQMHVISFLKSGNKDESVTLYSGQETKDPYLLATLMPSTDGSVSLNGVVKELFEAQWMMNHTVKSIKDQMDIASKLFFQTSDQNLAGRNILTAIEQGDVLVHALNQPLTQVNNVSHDIGTQESFGNLWKGLSNEIAGVSESMLGQTAPSGTAWRQVQAILNESHSLFSTMQQNKGLYLEEIVRSAIIPHIKEQLDNKDEITSVLEQNDITTIDAKYVPQEAIKRYNQQVIKDVLSGKQPNSFDATQMQQQVKDTLSGGMRTFKPSDIPADTWKEVMKDFEWEVGVNITGESSNTQDVLETLSTALNAVANPNFANNPQAQIIVSKILEATGQISPLELQEVNKPQPQTQQQPQLGSKPERFIPTAQPAPPLPNNP